MINKIEEYLKITIFIFYKFFQIKKKNFHDALYDSSYPMALRPKKYFLSEKEIYRFITVFMKLIFIKSCLIKSLTLSSIFRLYKIPHYFYIYTKMIDGVFSSHAEISSHEISPTINEDFKKIFEMRYE